MIFVHLRGANLYRQARVDTLLQQRERKSFSYIEFQAYLFIDQRLLRVYTWECRPGDYDLIDCDFADGDAPNIPTTELCIINALILTDAC